MCLTLINLVQEFYCRFSLSQHHQHHSTNKVKYQRGKRDEHSNSLSKIQVCAIFRAGDIRRNVLLKFTRLCMETPCLCPSDGHKYGGRKLTKTDVIEFAIKSL